MRRTWTALALLAFTGDALAYTYWNDIRHSAALPGGDVVIRAENLSGAGILNYVLYGNGDVVEEAMIQVLDGPSTVEAAVPGPGPAIRHYGFRLIQGPNIDFMPVRVANGASPSPGDLTRVAVDPAGDQQYGYVHLDLVDCRVSFSGTKLFAALTNAGGGFPVSQGLTFFGYLLAIADPALADPDTVFALMQTYNQAGIISPGLYKITGTGFGDLEKIGEVSVQEFASTNTLLLSCDRADLEADPYFQSWYDPADPSIGVAGFTQRITLLGGAAEADRTPGGVCSLREYGIAPFTNHAPALAGFSIEGAGSGAYARIGYADPDGHCPVVAEVVVDGGAPLPMRPQSLAYGSTVEYRTATGIEPLASGSWCVAIARFSDDLADTALSEISKVGVRDQGALGSSPSLRAASAPNPFRSATSIELEMGIEGPVRVEIFDVQGALVRSVLSDVVGAGIRRIDWDGRDSRGISLPSGLYFCTITSPGETVVQKLLLLR